MTLIEMGNTLTSLVMAAVMLLAISACKGGMSSDIQSGVPPHVPPAAPTITNPTTLNFNYAGGNATYLITGTVDSMTTSMTGPGGAVITPTAGSWSYNATLTDGASVIFTFYAFNTYNQQSAGTSVTIRWNPVVDLLLSGPISGGPLTDPVSSLKMEASSFIHPGEVKDATTNYVLQTGFNFATNSAR
jgi:hypothetical protein